MTNKKYRWHADIKPENILRIGNKFKLADLGESRIQLVTSDSDPFEIVPGGTISYGSSARISYTYFY